MVGFKLRKRRPGCDDSEVIGCGWATNPGQRADNQDRVAVSCRWAMVSDGVGGQRGGARAASEDRLLHALVRGVDRAVRAMEEEGAQRRVGRDVRRDEPHSGQHDHAQDEPGTE